MYRVLQLFYVSRTSRKLSVAGLRLVIHYSRINNKINFSVKNCNLAKSMNEQRTAIYKPATDNLQNSHKYISWLSHKKKVTRENCLHMFRKFVLFSRAIVFSQFHPLLHEKIPLCFAKLPLLLRNNAKHKT